jgi:arginase
MAEALVRVAGDDGRFSMSFDLDSLDPSVAPGVDCPVPEGLSLDEVRIALGMAADHGGILQLDVVEVNPTKDRCGRTSHIAVEAAATILTPMMAAEPAPQRSAAG